MTARTDSRGYLTLGRTWREEVAAWPEHRRARLREHHARLVAAGWNRDGGEFIAYERTKAEGENESQRSDDDVHVASTSRRE